MSIKVRIILAILALLVVIGLVNWLLGWIGPILIVLGLVAALYFGYRAVTRRKDATGWMTRRLSRQIEESARKQMADLERRQKQR